MDLLGICLHPYTSVGTCSTCNCCGRSTQTPSTPTSVAVRSSCLEVARRGSRHVRHGHIASEGSSTTKAGTRRGRKSYAPPLPTRYEPISNGTDTSSSTTLHASATSVAHDGGRSRGNQPSRCTTRATRRLTYHRSCCVLESSSTSRTPRCTARCSCSSTRTDYHSVGTDVGDNALEGIPTSTTSLGAGECVAACGGAGVTCATSTSANALDFQEIRPSG